MSDLGIPTSPLHQVTLGMLALAFVFLPNGLFAAIAGAPWEVNMLRLLGLVGVSLLAGLTWVRRGR